MNSGKIFTEPRKRRGKYSQSHYSPRLSVYILILYIVDNKQLFFEIEVNTVEIFTEPRKREVNFPKATIQQDWKE